MVRVNRMTPVRIGSLRRKPAVMLAEDAVMQASQYPRKVMVTMDGSAVWLEDCDNPVRIPVIAINYKTDPDLIAENIAWQVKPC